MKYKNGFLAICVSTSTIVLLLIIWSNLTDYEDFQLELPEDIETNYTADKNKILLNLGNLKLLLNNNPCVISRASPKNISAVQIVTSFAGNVEARSAIRRAYPKDELLKLGVVRVFLLARLQSHQSDVTQEALLNENSRFSDLIQGNFYEAYRNLTYKHLMGLKWASEYCKNVNFIIKMDDDILVNMYSLMEVIEEKYKENNFDLMGYILRNMKPIRIEANKWYVKKSEYQRSEYPNFLSGWLYITTPKVAQKLVSVAQTTPYFWIDDLFITGILAEKLKLTYKGMNEYFTYHPELFECCIRDEVICGFIVGPSGGDNDLQISYQKHSFKCYTNKCHSLPKGRTVENSCVTKRKQLPIRKGISEFKVIQLKK